MLELNLNIIWTFIDLVVIFLVLRHFLFRPVNQVIQKRQEMIQSSLEDAEQNKQQAQELKASYEKAMQDVRKEADALLAKAQKNAQEEYENVLKTARADAQALKINAERAAEEEKQKALRDLQINTADMVILAAQKVAEQQMTPQANQNMIEAFLAEAGEKQ